MGRIKKGAGSLFMLISFPIRCPFILIGLLANSFARTFREIQAAIGEFRKEKKALTQEDRLTTADLQKMKFAELLEIWGLSLEDLPRQILGHRLRIMAFTVILSLGAYQVWISREALFPFVFFVSGISLSAVSLTFITVSLWRISVYKNRRFVPIGAWLKQGGIHV